MKKPILKIFHVICNRQINWIRYTIYVLADPIPCADSTHLAMFSFSLPACLSSSCEHLNLVGWCVFSVTQSASIIQHSGMSGWNHSRIFAYIKATELCIKPMCPEPKRMSLNNFTTYLIHATSKSHFGRYPL